MKRNTLGFGIQFATAAMLAALTCLPAAAVEATPKAEPIAQPATAADVDETADACLNYTPVKPTDDEPVLLAALIQPAARGGRKDEALQGVPGPALVRMQVQRIPTGLL